MTMILEIDPINNNIYTGLKYIGNSGICMCVYEKLLTGLYSYKMMKMVSYH